MKRAPTIKEDFFSRNASFLWRPNPVQRRQDAFRWRGPAIVIARESKGRCYLGWEGGVLLVSKDQIRMVTSVECAGKDTIAQDAVLTAGGHTRNKTCQGVSHNSEVPRVERPFRRRRREIGIQKGKRKVQRKTNRSSLMNKWRGLSMI